MSGLSTHVLDTAAGVPAASVLVTLTSADGRELASARTNADGRIPDLAHDLGKGIFRLTFDTGAYFRATDQRGFYPEIIVSFEITDTGRHHHVPVLLSPFSYSTYLGS